MSKAGGHLTPHELAVKIAEFADEKKAIDTEVLDVSKISSFTQYMVITSGDSTPMIHAICKEIEEKLLEMGMRKPKWHGEKGSNWMILDLGSIVVHVMMPEERQKYNLEELWGKTAVIYHP